MQILFKSLTCHPNRGHAALLVLLLQKKGMYVSSIHKRPCKISLRKKKNVQPIPCRRENRHSFAGSPIICGRLFRDIRTFGRAVEGSSVSPLKNAMGRESATSGVCSAPSLIISWLRARAFGLGFALWHLLSSHRHSESIHHRKLQYPTTQVLSHALTVLFHSVRL